MEISIKWNVCRVCLVEDRRHANSVKYTPIDTTIAKQIHDIAGVQMDSDDNLPDKICRKCLILLKYACHFSTTCRNSDEYLQSIIRKTKSAASMLKLDKQRERAVDLLFDYDTELPTIGLEGDDQEHTTMDVDSNTNDEIKPDSKYLAEKIGDNADGNVDVSELIHKIPNISEFTQDDEPPESTIFGKTQGKQTKVNDSYIIASKKKLTDDERENGNHELIEEDYEDNEIEHYDDKITSSTYNQQYLEENIKSVCSMDGLDYTDDDDDDAKEDVPDDTLNITNDESDYNSKEANQVNAITNSNTELEQNNIRAGSGKHNDLFYFIKVEDAAVHEMEDSVHSENIDETTNAGSGEGCEVDEEEDHVQLIDNQSETDCYEDGGGGGGVEHVDENSERNKSIIPLEEYLLEESVAETVVQQQQEYVEVHEAHEAVTQHISTTTIKIIEREDRSSPNGCKRPKKEYTFSCDVCGNNFTSRSLRNYHMRIHRNERNFECELCFKRFTAACNLTAHMRIHTGEKPYECKYCFRRFTDRSTHIKHERIHTNEKPFQCNTCGKSFSLSTTLRTHEKVHTNEKPFKCAPCNKSFKLPHQLKAHVLSNQHKNMLMSNDLDTLD